MIVERDDGAARADRLAQPELVHAVEPRQRHDREPCTGRRLDIRGSVPGVREHPRAVGEHHAINPFARHPAGADGHPVAGRIGERQRPFHRDEAEVAAAGAVHERVEERRHFGLGARLGHHQARHRGQGRDVAHRLVRVSRTAGQQTGERGHVNDLRALAALVVDLFVRPRREEAGERVDQRQRAAAGHAGGHRHHVLLGDAALDEPIGKAVRKREETAVLDQIGVEHERVGPALAQRDERLLVGAHEVVGLPRLAPRIANARLGGHGAETKLREARVGGGQQLLEPGRVLRLGRGSRVKEIEIGGAERGGPFHEAHAAPLDGVGNQHLGAIGHGVEGAEHALERVHVVAVAARDVPAERAQLLGQIAKRADLVHPGVGLDLVVVDDRGDLAEAARHRRAQRLPELPFLQLAVSGEHEDAARPAGETVGQGHALGLGDTHAERAGVGLNVRRLDVRVARQPVQPPQLVERIGGQQAEADEHRVERRRVVPLRREEDVARVVTVIEVAHLVEEQPAHDLERTEAGADVPGPRAGDHPQRVDAGQRREGAHAGAARRRRRQQPAELGDRHEAELERFTLVGL